MLYMEILETSLQYVYLRSSCKKCKSFQDYEGPRNFYTN